MPKLTLVRGEPLIKIACVFGIFFMPACSAADLTKVQEFANLAGVAKEHSEQVGRDFYPSCLRQAQYVPIDPLPSTGESVSSNTQDFLGEISDETRQEIEDLEAARRTLIGELQSSLIGDLSSGSSDPLTLRNELRALCDSTVQALGPSFSSVNGTVLLYIRQLGLVANQDSSSLEPEFNEFRTNAVSLGSSARTLFSVNDSEGSVISQEQLNTKVNAAISILQFITEAILEDRRRELLTEVILDKNDDFREVVNALKIVVNDYYIAVQLRNEESALDAVYTTYIDALQSSQTFQSGQAVIPVTGFLIQLENSWSEDKEIIQARRETAQAYIGVLNALSSGHQQLFEIFSDGDEPTEEELQAILESNTTALKKFVDKSDQLSSKNFEK